MGYKHKDTTIQKLQDKGEESADRAERGDPSEYRAVDNDKSGYKLINNKKDDRFNTNTVRPTYCMSEQSIRMMTGVTG
jgi:hypothetical protein